MKASKKRVNGFQSQCIKLKIVIASKVKFDSIDNWIPFNTVFQKWPKLDDHQHHATHFHFCPNHHWCNGVRAESTTSANTVSHTVYTVTKDHWSSAKRLNAHMKHLLFERGGGGQPFSGCELNRPSVQVSHKKKQMFTPPRLRSNLGLYEPHKCKHPEISLLTQTPKRASDVSKKKNISTQQPEKNNKLIETNYVIIKILSQAEIMRRRHSAWVEPSCG